MDCESLLRSYQQKVERRIHELLPPPTAEPSRLHEAMRYSCLAPGKRIRPALCLASCEALGASGDQALDAAAALEMIHVFSLIHDDLPAIDDDDLRRGKPTCHIVYGEGLAILAGDALFALGFECLAAAALPAEAKARALLSLARATGSNGLVGGEVADVEAEGTAATAEVVSLIHARKTGALIAASCEIGGICAGGDDRRTAALRDFGMRVGLAFQITDDILNETASSQALGKAVGSDRLRNKATYPALYGVEQSQRAAAESLEAGLRHLQDAGIAYEPLAHLARYAAERIH